MKENAEPVKIVWKMNFMFYLNVRCTMNLEKNIY